MSQSKNAMTLGMFSNFCHKHPELRFWQALVAWVSEGQPKLSQICWKLFDGEKETCVDTYYKECRE